MGTIVNTIAVIVSGLIGCLMSKGLKQKYTEIINQAMGLCVMMIGLTGAMKGLLEINDGTLQSKDTYTLIIAMVIGSVVGEWIDIEKRMEQFGAWLQKVTQKQDSSSFIEGFVNCSLVICVGAMAVVGAIQDGILHDPSMLYTKAALDFMITLVFASMYGIGAAFASVPIFIIQGGITLISQLISPMMTAARIAQLSCVGSILVVAVGINIAFGKKFRVGNMLPALLIVCLLV